VQNFSSPSEEYPLVPVLKKTASFTNPLDRLEIMPPENAPQMSEHEQDIETPVFSATIESSARKNLPEEVKKIFEKSSGDFTKYASRTEKEKEPDEWDRAILFGKPFDLEKKEERYKPKRLPLPVIEPVVVPQKIQNKSILEPISKPPEEKRNMVIPMKPKKPILVPQKKTIVVPLKPKQIPYK
jgi:hypothetical protein